MRRQPSPRRWFSHAGVWAAGVRVALPGQITPLAERVVVRFLRPLVMALYRPSLKGFENLPEDRPFLLVANHSGGAGIAEILGLLVLYVQRFGRQRPLAGFALPLGFHVFP